MIATGQEDGHTFQQNEIGYTSFELEANSETFNGKLEPKLYHGIYFNWQLANTNWSWISSIGYGENIIMDDCQNCRDHLHGRGQLNEFSLATGIRYTFLQQKRTFVNPFIQSSAHYSYMRYAGNFSGGFSGGGAVIDRATNVGGLQARVGAQLFPFNRMPVTLATGFRVGWGTSRGYRETAHDGIASSAATATEVSVGYLF